MGISSKNLMLHTVLTTCQNTLQSDMKPRQGWEYGGRGLTSTRTALIVISIVIYLASSHPRTLEMDLGEFLGLLE